MYSRILLQATIVHIENGEDERSSGEITRAHARVGSPAAEIVTLAEELRVGLVMTGSRGIGGIRRGQMDSVAGSIVRHAHCPILVVRPEKDCSAEHGADFLTKELLRALLR